MNCPRRHVSCWPSANSSGWWWLISSVFLSRTSCHKTAHANGYYGAWPGWAVPVSVLPLTVGRLFRSGQLLSRVRLFVTPVDCSTPGLPVHHQLPELTQTHVHWVSDAIQPSQPLSSPSPPTFSSSQHQGLFQGVSFSHQVTKAL